jgi:hypothetical protein
MGDADRPTPPGVPHPVVNPRAAFRRLPEGASTEQLLHAYHEGMAAYANLAVEYRDLAQRCESRIETVVAEVVVLGVRVSAMEMSIAEIQRKAPPPLPPMRPELGSNHDLARAVGTTVAARIDAEARNPATPPPDAKTMARIAESVVASAFTKVKADAWSRIESERGAAETDRLAYRRKLITVSVVTSITTLGAVVTALVEHFAK